MAMPAPSDPAPTTRRTLDALVARGATPGFQHVFAAADGWRFSHHGGLADPRAQRPVTAATSFNTYSVTKTLTAAAVLQLVDQGLVDLDQPLARHVGQPPLHSTATVRQALLHTAGFANPNPLAWVHLDHERMAFDSRRFVGDLLQARGQPTAAPGAGYAYSNIGYLWLGLLVEQVSGLPYSRFVADRLITPLRLGAGETLAFDLPDPAAHACGTLRRFGWLNAVFGWLVDRDRLVDSTAGPWVQMRHHQVNGEAYGGLIGNAAGLVRYGLALLNRDDLLSPASRALLFSAQPAPGPARSLGWVMGSLDREPWCAHAGGGAGYYAELRIYPRLGCASAVLFNRAGIRDERFLDRLDRALVAARR